MIEWKKLTKEDDEAIDKIAERVDNILKNQNVTKGISLIDLKMDLGAAHLVYPMRLDEMAETDDTFTLMHDVIGIARNLNRETGQMEHCFVPRFSR